MSEEIAPDQNAVSAKSSSLIDVRGVLIFLLIVGGIGLFLRFSGPVIISIPHLSDTIRGEPSFVLFNPFRDRIPEEFAEAFLTKLKNGPCEEIVNSQLLDKESQKNICEKQREYPLKNWRLIYRSEHRDGRIWLAYRHWSGKEKGSEDMHLNVVKQGSEWRVEKFGIVY